MSARWLVCLVVLVGCKKEPAAPGVEAPGAPASTTDQDAQWKLAPDSAIAGVVASPRGVAMIERGVIAFDALIAGVPDLAPLHRQMEDAWTRALGSSKPSLAALGLTADQGFAMFITEHDGTAMVLPVADRDKFVARLHGRKDGDHDAFDQDPFDKGTVCKPVGGRYVCVDHAALFDKLGHGNLATARALAGARGDVELVHRRSTDATVAVVAQLAPGAFVVRGTVRGVLREVTEILGNPVRPRDGSATAAAFGVVDLSPFVARLPPVPIAPGVTAAQLGRSIAGPATFVIPAGSQNFASLDLGVRIPLNDPAPAKAVVEHCTDIPPLAAAGATVKDGACHLTVPSPGLEIDAWVDGKELRIGKRAETRTASIAANPMATELAQGAWSLALFGRGSYFSPENLGAMSAALKGLPPELSIMSRSLPVFNEFAAGLRKDGDALHFVVGVRTAWANPAGVVDKLLAISPEQIASGQATQTAKSIAASAPSSPFAQDLAAGTGGVVGLLAPLGIVAAVAVPAFLDYMKRSKKTEAELQLNKIAKNARRVYEETHEFPKGRAVLTPATTCCGGPIDHINHCVTAPDDWLKNPVWSALDFEIDEPSLYRYSYESDGQTFTAKAVGDLDCDGVDATYELNGRIDPATNNPVSKLTPPPPGVY